jgi:hypothetical protein
VEPEPDNAGGGNKVMNQTQIGLRIQKSASLDKLEGHFNG